MEVTDRIIKEQLKTCWRFGARYDLFIYESDIIHSNLWSTVFESLKKKGIVRLETEGKLEGCWVVTVEGETEGEEKVLVRSDGTATYVAKDIPTAALKIALVPDPFKYSVYTAQPDGTNIWRTMVGEGERKTSPVPWGSENLTLIDSRQARLQRIVQYILAKSSGEDIKSKYGYVAYAIISLSPKTASALSITSEESEGEQQKVVTMSGRHGTYVNADDAMDLVKEKALEETKKRNPTVENPDWFDGVAEKLAISAIRFSILKQDLDKMIVFDSEESLKLIGETGPYLLYTYARASSVLSKLDASKRNSGEPLIQTPEEIALLKTISKFSLSVEKTVKNLAPKWLAHYTYALSESFNSFYEVNRIIQEPNERTRNSRIELTKATRSVLASCLYLLGIEASERI
jgi:arginyl-tRNA synthetase